MSYIITTDSTCDLTTQYIDNNGLNVIGLLYTIDGQTKVDDNFRAQSPKVFYDLIRAGKESKTTLINTERYLEFFENLLAHEDQILHVGFSSGLSGSVESALVAAQALNEKYPQKKIVVVDTLCGSLGQGMMVHLALKNQRENMTMQENAKWLEDNRLNINHWITVDDLHHLHRGGRVSATSAFLGSMLSVKPCIHVNNEGKLIVKGKVRGRKQSLKDLVDIMERQAVDPDKYDVFISHGDCLEDAQFVGDMIKERLKVPMVFYHEAGPVIGSHTGAGLIALFFYGKDRG